MLCASLTREIRLFADFLSLASISIFLKGGYERQEEARERKPSPGEDGPWKRVLTLVWLLAAIGIRMQNRAGVPLNIIRSE